MDSSVVFALHRFVQRGDELRSTPVVTGGANLSFSIQFEAQKYLRFTTTEPPHNDLNLLILALRHFLLQREATYIGKVYSHCNRYLASDRLLQYVRDGQRQWRQMQKASGLKVVVDDQEWSPEKVAWLWLNGWYYHNDEDKAVLLDKLLPHAGMFVRHVFLSYMLDTAKVALHLRNVVDVGLSEGLFR